MYDREPLMSDVSRTFETAPAEDGASDLVVAIISYGFIGLLVVGWGAFAVWVARFIHLELVAIEQGLKPVGTGRGYSEFAWALHETIGLWPTTLLFFAAMISPIPGIYFETRRQKFSASD